MAIAFHAEVYVPGHSPVHRWAVRPKLISLLALMFAIALIQHLTLLPWVMLTVLGLYALAQLPPSYLLKRLPYPGLFIVAMVSLLPWVSGTTILWQGLGLALRLEGLQSATLIAGRFLAIILTGFVLLGTTPFLEILKALRRLGMPALMTDMTLLTYRYLFDIASQLETMQQAMKLRGHGALRQSVRRQWGWGVALFGSLLLRSYERSQRVYKAMHLRGYGQPLPSETRLATPFLPPSPLTPWLTGGTLGVVLALVFAEWMLPAV